MFRRGNTCKHEGAILSGTRKPVKPEALPWVAIHPLGTRSWSAYDRSVIGDYEQIEQQRRRAWRMMRFAETTADRDVHSRLCDELGEKREQYLRALLAQLPFRWHIEHAYTPHETATHGGGDHVIVDEEVRIGRLVRLPGDALSRTRQKFWSLTRVNDDRLPDVLADIRVAERIAARLR
jgi:hypothetical protein